jgi:hypothetical protein
LAEHAGFRTGGEGWRFDLEQTCDSLVLGLRTDRFVPVLTAHNSQAGQVLWAESWRPSQSFTPFAHAFAPSPTQKVNKEEKKILSNMDVLSKKQGSLIIEGIRVLI